LFRRAPRRDEKAATRKRLAYEKSIGLGRLQGSLPSVLDMIDAQLDAASQDPPQTDAARMRLKVGGRLKGFLELWDSVTPLFPRGKLRSAFDDLDGSAWLTDSANADKGLPDTVRRVQKLKIRLEGIRRLIDSEFQWHQEWHHPRPSLSSFDETARRSVGRAGLEPATGGL
jgi:hypothetical protein